MSSTTFLLLAALVAPQGGGPMGSSSPSAAQVTSVFAEWNLITRKDVHSWSDVSGSALIGGDLHGSSNFSTHSVTATTGEGLMLVGGLGGSINVNINNGGDLRAGGNFTHKANLNGGGKIQPGFPKLIQALINNTFGEAYKLQASCVGLKTNGIITNAHDMVATSTVVNGHQVAVYSIDQSSIAGRPHLNLIKGNADLVVINFDASSTRGVASFQAPPNLVGDFNKANSAQIIWNFLNTKSLVINNNFSGMVLAPDADLVLAGGGINGTVLVDGVSNMNAPIRGHTMTSSFAAGGCIFRAQFTSYGSGCVGSQGVPTLSITEMPRIGQDFEIALTDVPTNKTGFLLLGSSNTSWNGVPLPLSLPFQPKCSVLVSAQTVVRLSTGPSTTLKWGFPMPNNPAMLGGSFYSQAMFLDAVFFLPRIAMTNGGHAVIGCD